MELNELIINKNFVSQPDNMSNEGPIVSIKDPLIIVQYFHLKSSLFEQIARRFSIFGIILIFFFHTCFVAFYYLYCVKKPAYFYTPTSSFDISIKRFFFFFLSFETPLCTFLLFYMIYIYYITQTITKKKHPLIYILYFIPKLSAFF